MIVVNQALPAPVIATHPFAGKVFPGVGVFPDTQPAGALDGFWAMLMDAQGWREEWGMTPTSLCPELGYLPGATPLAAFAFANNLHVTFDASFSSQEQDVRGCLIFGFIEAIRLLVQGGMPLDCPFVHAWDKPHRAGDLAEDAIRNPAWFLQALLALGLDPNHVSPEGKTLVEILCKDAAQEEAPEKLVLLRDAGFDFAGSKNGAPRIDAILSTFMAIFPQPHQRNDEAEAFCQHLQCIRVDLEQARLESVLPQPPCPPSRPGTRL
jgi:hypothetical protein